MALPRAEPFDAALERRTVSALVLVAVALLGLWLGGWWLAALVAAAIVIMAQEWTRLARGVDGVGQGLLRLAVILFPLLALWQTMHGGPVRALLVLLLGSVLAAGGVAVAAPAGAFRAALGVVYLGLPAVALLALRNHPASGPAHLLWLFLVVWTTDIAAYLVGRSIGGPKLAPGISPGKTWAGLLGGVLGAALVGTIVSGLLGGIAGLGTLVGGLLAVVAQAGDLFESHLKREAGVKDSGTLIPGHGGALDRLDGLLFAAPVYAFLVGPGGARIVA
jgi:phosphatidate cytidylyltransferase